jgi:hypothetical protein
VPTLFDELSKITKIIAHCGVPADTKLDEGWPNSAATPGTQCGWAYTKHYGCRFVVD